MHGCNPRCSILSDISQESQFVYVVGRNEVNDFKMSSLNLELPNIELTYIKVEGRNSLINDGESSSIWSNVHWFRRMKTKCVRGIVQGLTLHWKSWASVERVLTSEFLHENFQSFARLYTSINRTAVGLCYHLRVSCCCIDGVTSISCG